MKKKFLSISGACLAALALVAGACTDDDSAQNAEDAAGALEEFTNDLNGTNDIVQASDDVKDSMKDNCGDLQDSVDSDDLDEFCNALGEAVDDDDQQAYTALKGAFPAIQQQVEAQIAADIQDAASDDDGDDPLEGGDPGDDPLDDGDDDGTDNENDDADDDDVDDDDVENPLDNE
jgi:hypothetical protein